MKKSKTGIIIRIICLTLTALVLLGILLWGMHFRFGSWHLGDTFSFSSNYSYANSSRYEIGGASFPGEGITELEINWTAGSVEFQLTQDSNISFQEPGGLEEDDQLRYLVSGNRLILQYRKSGWTSGRVPSKALTIQIPQSLADQLVRVEINTASASITAQGLQAREFEIDGYSGDAVLENCQFKDLEMDTVSGGLRFSGQVEDLDFDGVSADMTLTLTAVPQEISFDSVSGSATLNLPADAAFEATLDSVSGRTNCTFPATLQGGTYYCGQGGGVFQFDTVSGDVTIRPAE